jgi:hypothetical protein
MELSCSRFELETLENCRRLGKLSEDPKHKRNYYGLGCISVQQITSFSPNIEGFIPFELAFTPITEELSKNYFHCDIYDSYGHPIEGVANPAQVNYIKELFKERWNPFIDIENLLIKRYIQPKLEKQ